MKRVALYVRLSTAGKGQDPETQLMHLREWVSQRGLTIFREYLDLGVSGSKQSRPGLDLMMADARKHRFDMVLVARFDRFARSVSHLLRALEEFNKLDIDFVSLSESIDTSTPMGKLVFTILGAVAELERNLIRERVQAGVDRARKQGKALGRPTVSADRAGIIQRHRAGASIASLARLSGLARSTIRRIVASPGEKAHVSPGESLISDESKTGYQTEHVEPLARGGDKDMIVDRAQGGANDSD